MTEKKYIIKPPLGNIIITRKNFTERDIREFIPQVIQDPEAAMVWKEKAAKDSIDELIDWLKQAGYTVEPVDN